MADKKLCRRVKKGLQKDCGELTRDAKFVCKKCGRAAAKRKHVCKPKKL